MKLASTGKIKGTKGYVTIARAKDVFTGWIDPDFKSWGTDVAGPDAKAQNVSAYELGKDGTFRDIYYRLSSDLDSLCLTQGQIVEFMKNCEDKEHWFFFLFKVGNDFFVARSRWYDGELGARVDRFSHDYVWDAGRRRLFVVPQLTPSEPRDLTPSPLDPMPLILIINGVEYRKHVE